MLCVCCVYLYLNVPVSVCLLRFFFSFRKFHHKCCSATPRSFGFAFLFAYCITNLAFRWGRVLYRNTKYVWIACMATIIVYARYAPDNSTGRRVFIIFENIVLIVVYTILCAGSAHILATYYRCCVFVIYSSLFMTLIISRQLLTIYIIITQIYGCSARNTNKYTYPIRINFKSFRYNVYRIL